MEAIVVPTTHWDREWYHTFQTFRARLVDTVDVVLQLLASDDDYTFLLDGQSIVLEDYLEIRPQRAAELEGFIRAGRVEIGPWYVQPDSLLPSGEAHVRNLLEGRRAGEQLGPVTRVAYTPDSFGHPAQFPQIFAGFGLDHFVYWRGNADEISELPAEYAWESPDGSVVCACHLAESYSNAAGLPLDVDHAARRLRKLIERLAQRTTSDRVLLLAGTDHQPPQTHTREVCRAVEEDTGWKARRGLLRDFVEGISAEGRPAFRGELLGGFSANLLPGVWSTRTYLKLLNRHCETALEGWAEPWTAIGRLFGTPDERPALRSAWRQLLQNQAHDSICGCSQDAVHEQMLPRYAYAGELAQQTTKRACELMAGLPAQRRVPFTDDLQIAVWNPSPHPRTDVVRFNLDAYPPFATQEEARPFHPLLWTNLRPRGFEVSGHDSGPGWSPARMVVSDEGKRVRLTPDQRDWAVEVVVTDLPAFGYKRVRLRSTEEVATDETDRGDEITNGTVTVRIDDGGFSVLMDDRELGGLCVLEDTGDRGETYDFDPVERPVGISTNLVERRRHPEGIQELEIEHVVAVPRLSEDRSSASSQTDPCRVTVVARLAPGVHRVDLDVVVDNHAPDHRLRMLFPTGAAVDTFEAATTFDVAKRSTAARDASSWLHPAPTTFPSQGWTHANGLTVVAPGLNEAEVTPEGVIAVTLLRAVGWLSRGDLTTRPLPAGPCLPTPGAQCMGTTQARISLLPGLDPRAARDAELGLLGTHTGPQPLVEPGLSLLTLEPEHLVLSALKPAEDGDGVVLRVLNPTATEHEASLELGLPVSSATAVRLDEEPAGYPVTFEGQTLRFAVPPHALRSIRLRS